MTEFTPVSSTIGGILIGLNAVILLVLLGRIAGASGVPGGLLDPPKQNDRAWRVAFFIGMVGTGAVCAMIWPDSFVNAVPRSRLGLIIAGLLVGLGTRIGNGCTSGHAVCGMGRFSKRSITATMIFMAVAIATVYMVRVGEFAI